MSDSSRTLEQRIELWRNIAADVAAERDALLEQAEEYQAVMDEAGAMALAFASCRTERDALLERVETAEAERDAHTDKALIAERDVAIERAETAEWLLEEGS